MRYCFALVVLLAAQRARAEPPSVDFLNDVRPIFQKHCLSCHGSDRPKAGLRLDSLAAVRRGGRSGPVVVPHRSSASVLIAAVAGSADEAATMPPRGAKLTADEVRVLRAWVDAGAETGQDAASALRESRPHWAFRPPVRPALPIVATAAWCKNPVDRFILARLEARGFDPGPEAERVTLLRRLSFDLVGLPPSPAEVDAFLADPRPDAYERAADRLLASPHYGERMARHWLDVARYADSDGYNLDLPRAIWKYRDWVIDAKNRNLPFDRFVVEQLAGDLLPDASKTQRVATGFHRNTLRNQEGGVDREQFRIEAVADRVNTTGTAFLGLTVGCARCHNHKTDPLSQREYFQLFAFFNDQEERTLELPTDDEERLQTTLRDRAERVRRTAEPLRRLYLAGQAEWERQMSPTVRAAMPDEVRAALTAPAAERTAEQRALLATKYLEATDASRFASGVAAASPSTWLQAALLPPLVARVARERDIAQLKSREPEVVTTLILEERTQPRTTHVHRNGDFTRPGPRVEPGLPAALDGSLLPATPRPSRLDLARWLVAPRHPLTARVTVNRLWQLHFGVGLVATENDFGSTGTPPSHPALLDWLATEFVASGWDVKALHRLIVTSATYRQASRARPALAEADPRNTLLGRQSRLRLEAETIRDAALAASGSLCRRIGGPSVFPPQPDGVTETAAFSKKWLPSVGPDRYRRGLYTTFWRTTPHPFAVAFDAPAGVTACTRRGRSNTPLQALLLLNDPAFLEFAQALAARTLREAPDDDTARLRFVFRQCLARSPRAVETSRLLRFLHEQQAELAAAPDEARALVGAAAADADPIRLAAWTLLGRVLLNLDEFITRE